MGLRNSYQRSTICVYTRHRIVFTILVVSVVFVCVFIYMGKNSLIRTQSFSNVSQLIYDNIWPNGKRRKFGSYPTQSHATLPGDGSLAVSNDSASRFNPEKTYRSAYDQKLKQLGMESTGLHAFKSQYIVNPPIHVDDTLTVKTPGRRKSRVISCFNCPAWFHDADHYDTSHAFARCPHSRCSFDGQGTRLSEADVVLFFPTPHQMPPRPLGQIWAYCSWESPVHYEYPTPYDKWGQAFNWTCGYRHDADMFMPYNKLAWRDTDVLLSDEYYQNIARAKRRTAAWFVGNCHTIGRREDYVREMKNYIDIDVYGHCGSLNCPRFSSECFEFLNRTYKFYLSFENSFCKDYVTEKFFNIFNDRLHVIPVFRGGFAMDTFLPPNTFLDANNFQSAKDLALYLRDLGDDIDQYSRMLKEKDRLKNVGKPKSYDWCELCEKLHGGVESKTIMDIEKYSTENICWN